MLQYSDTIYIVFLFIYSLIHQGVVTFSMSIFFRIILKTPPNLSHISTHNYLKLQSSYIF